MRVWYPANVLEGLAVHPQIRWIIRRQMIVTLVAGLLAGMLLGFDAAVSAALGGSIAVSSALTYAWRAWRQSEAEKRDAKTVFNAQVAAEGYKFAITLLLFALVFKNYARLAALPLFLTYAATIVVYWLALLKQQ